MSSSCVDVPPANNDAKPRRKRMPDVSPDAAVEAVMRRRMYHRQYQSKKYKANPDTMRVYHQSLRLKRTLDPEEGAALWNLYKGQLCDVYTMQKIWDRLPEDTVDKLWEERKRKRTQTEAIEQIAILEHDTDGRQYVCHECKCVE